MIKKLKGSVFSDEITFNGSDKPRTAQASGLEGDLLSLAPFLCLIGYVNRTVIHRATCYEEWSWNSAMAISDKPNLQRPQFANGMHRFCKISAGWLGRCQTYHPMKCDAEVHVGIMHQRVCILVLFLSPIIWLHILKFSTFSVSN